MDATPIIIKKKKAHAHGHHGGSWKVAYADFVTAMMAFFMVMWIMGLSDDTKAQIQGYFNDPIGFKSPPKSKLVVAPKSMPITKPGQARPEGGQPYQDEHKAMKQLKAQLEQAMKSSPELSKLLDHVKIEITDEGLRIEFIEDKNDFFELGEAVLKPGAVALIHKLGPLLAASGRPMMIEGHTDSAPFQGDPLGNFRLSGARATSLLEELGKSGVKPEKVKDVKALADRELRDTAHPLSTVNRRVTILLPYVTPVTATTPNPKDAVTHQMEQPAPAKTQITPEFPNLALGKL